MTVEIKDLVSNDQYPVDLTDAELSKVNGGYASLVLADTGNIGLAADAAVLVFGKRNTSELVEQQVRLGVPRTIVEQGAFLADFSGGGIYTLPVTSSKLQVP